MTSALTQGLHSLDGLAGGDFCSLDDDRACKVLKRIEAPNSSALSVVQRSALFPDGLANSSAASARYAATSTQRSAWAAPGS